MAGPAPVRLMQQRVWRLRQRHLVVTLKNQDRERSSKAAQRLRANPEVARKPALPRESRVRVASSPVSHSRRPAAHQLALLASRARNRVGQDKAREQEFRAKVLNRRKCRSPRRDQSRAGQRELNGKVLRVRLLVSKKVSELQRAKRSRME